MVTPTLGVILFKQRVQAEFRRFTAVAQNPRTVKFLPRRTSLARAYPSAVFRLHRTLPPISGRPTPSGPDGIHEIKHDGYRLMARRDSAAIRLLTRNGHEWASRYPLIVEAVNRL